MAKPNIAAWQGYPRFALQRGNGWVSSELVFLSEICQNFLELISPKNFSWDGINQMPSMDWLFIAWSALAGKRGNLGNPQHSIQSMLLRWYMSCPDSPVEKESLWSQVLFQDSALARELTNYSGKFYSSLRTDKICFLNKSWLHSDVDIFMTEK